MTTTSADLDNLDHLLEEYASAHVEYWTSEDDSPFEADAKKRREGAAAAIREQLANVEEELAKTRADLAATHTELDRLRGVIREGVDMAEWHRNEITTWKRKAARLREQLGNAKARISAAATVEVWTNEDGKRFVFADDLMAALDPNPEANPATTAEPADEPKARREPKLKRADIFDEILAYPCPSCGVSAGTVCVNRDRRFSHIKRRTLAGANAEPAAS